MGKPTDVRPIGARLYFLPLRARIPVKFGPETTRDVTSARVCLRVEDRKGASAEGWGETPLSVSWVWPSSVPLAEREQALQALCAELTAAWARFDVSACSGCAPASVAVSGSRRVRGRAIRPKAGSR